MKEDSFIEDLLKLMPDEAWRFVAVATALHEDDSTEFVLRLCNTPWAVVKLTAALDPAARGPQSTRLVLALLLSMSKAGPSTVDDITRQPGVVKELQELSEAKGVDGKPKSRPDASRLLQLLK
jgi:hypothetical protein